MKDIKIIAEITPGVDCGTIAAIKDVRLATGWGLKESKDFVERVLDQGSRGLRVRVTDRLYGRFCAAFHRSATSVPKRVGGDAADGALRIKVWEVEITRGDVLDLT